MDSPWNSPGQNTGVGSFSLLQEIFPTQGSNPGLPHCRQVLSQLSHQGSPRILEWEPIPSSGGLLDPGIELGTPASQVDSLPAELPGKPKLISHPTNPPYIPGSCHHLQHTAPHLPHPLPDIHIPIVKTCTVSTSSPSNPFQKPQLTELYPPRLFPHCHTRSRRFCSTCSQAHTSIMSPNGCRRKQT